MILHLKSIAKILGHLLTFIGAALLISIGITGYYIAQIYDEVRDRPRYIISDTAGLGDTDR